MTGGAGAQGGVLKSGEALVPGDKRPIVLGLYYVDDSSGSAGSFIGDGKKLGEAVVAYINAHGGFGGHQAKLVTYGEPITETKNTTHDQAACTTFTRDNDVIATASLASATPTYYQCMGDRGAVMVDGSADLPDQATFMKYKNYLFGNWPSSDRIGATYAESLIRQGYFRDPGMKLGVLWVDHPWWKTELNAFLARTSAAGIKPTDVMAVCSGSSCARTDLQNTIVKLRSDGVTHVVFLGSGGTAISFIPSATAQSYYPRYGIMSQDFPAFIALNNSPTALRNAIGMGFDPPFDVEPAQEGTPNRAAQICLEIARKVGQSPQTALASLQVRGNCDNFFLLKAMLDRAKDTSAAGLRAALDGLGGSFQPSAHFNSFFSPTRHDGADTYKDLGYNVGCKCFEYRGGLRPMVALPGQK